MSVGYAELFSCKVSIIYVYSDSMEQRYKIIANITI